MDGCTLSDSQLSKLPGPVRDEIFRLTKSVAFWKEQCEVGPDGSDTFAHVGFDGHREVRRPLGWGAQVEFELDEKTRVDARLEDGVLTISNRAHSTRDLFTVQPWASNVFKIRVLKGDR